MTAISRRHLLAGGLGAVTAGALGSAVPAAAEPWPAAGEPVSGRRIRAWAAATWASLVAMTDEGTGLTADNIQASVRNPIRSGYTSPTNIGGYLWSAIVARDLGLISRQECSRRIRQTLLTLPTLEFHEPSGMFYNWYDEETTKKLTTWPVDSSAVLPFLSSVDNGWLAAALIVVQNADRPNAERARRLLDRMNFRAFFNKDGNPRLGLGLIRGGFWDGPHPSSAVEGNYLGRGDNVWYTDFHYDTTVSETRITYYIAIARGQIPAKTYFSTWRTFPNGCDWNWQEQRPVGRTREYLGVPVFEGAYRYRGMRIVPGWGGSMFEALMPNMFVPEERWAPNSWGINHPLTVRAHREHGLDDAGYGYWGFSPASDPMIVNGYREYGVDAIGLNPDGYFSDVERTNYDPGYLGCPLPGDQPTNPNPDYGNGVVTPHALFLAMHHEPRQAYDNLRRLQRNLGAYGEGGFYDAIAVNPARVAQRYLSLDQAMVMGSIGNVFGNDIVRRAFCAGDIRRRIRPLIAPERFGAGPA